MTSTNGDDRRGEQIPAASESHDSDTSTLQSTENEEFQSAPADKPQMTESWRQVVGNQMQSVSDIINDNLVAARYASFASIALLSAYGLANTPLFFRFKTVSDIPGTLRYVTLPYMCKYSQNVILFSLTKVFHCFYLIGSISFLLSSPSDCSRSVNSSS